MADQKIKNANTLAKRAGIEPKTILRVLKREINPTLKTICEISVALDVPVRELFDPEKKPASGRKKRK